MLLRRFAWSDFEIRAGHYATFAARMLLITFPVSTIDGRRRRAWRYRHGRRKSISRSGCHIAITIPEPPIQTERRRWSSALSLEQLLAKSVSSR